MVIITRALSCVLFAVLALTPSLAATEPKQPSEEESADASFAKSFVGKSYDDELDIDGWTDLGGGLVSPPIYVRQYLREEDGANLVLTSREVSKATATAPASYMVSDALFVPKAQKDIEFSIACVEGDDGTLKFLGEAKGSEDKEWWTDVRRAWEISLETGQIASIKPKGLRCTNPGW
jgi:hypothetical protein